MNWLFCMLLWLCVVKGVNSYIEDEFEVSIFSIPETNVYDEGTVSLSLPFSFNFYDATFDDVVIGSNGFVAFTQTTDALYPGGEVLGQGRGVEYMIAPTWTDLFSGSQDCGSNCGFVRAGQIDDGAFAVVFDRIPYALYLEHQIIVSWELVLYSTGVVSDL